MLKLPSNLMHLTARKEFNLSTSKFPSVLMSALVTTMFLVNIKRTIFCFV